MAGRRLTIASRRLTASTDQRATRFNLECRRRDAAARIAVSSPLKSNFVAVGFEATKRIVPGILTTSLSLTVIAAFGRRVFWELARIHSSLDNRLSRRAVYPSIGSSRNAPRSKGDHNAERGS